jgi:hypothetical protein
VQTEDFVTYRNDYVTSDDIDLLLDFKKDIVTPMCQKSTTTPEKRRLMKPLSDAIDKCKRLYGSKK